MFNVKGVKRLENFNQHVMRLEYTEKFTFLSNCWKILIRWRKEIRLPKFYRNDKNVDLMCVSIGLTLCISWKLLYFIMTQYNFAALTYTHINNEYQGKNKSVVKCNCLTHLKYRDTGYLISISIQYVDIFQPNTEN